MCLCVSLSVCACVTCAVCVALACLANKHEVMKTHSRERYDILHNLQQCSILGTGVPDVAPFC